MLPNPGQALFSRPGLTELVKSLGIYTWSFHLGARNYQNHDQKNVNLFLMPKVFEINGYRFSFYSNENDEPPHVHINKGNGTAKYWLLPKIYEVYSYGFKLRE